MSFDSRKKDFGREHIYIVEMDLDYCNNTYQTSPCLAGIWQMGVSGITGTWDVGDTFSGGTSLAEGVIVESGATPWDYRITNGIQFTGTETLTNTSQTGSASKTVAAPVAQGDEAFECYNTLESCQDVTNYTSEYTTASDNFVVQSDFDIFW